MKHHRTSRSGAEVRNRERVGRGRGALGALVAALLLGASGARAAPFVDVTYDLSDSTAVSTIQILNVTTTVPPQGSLTGQQTLRYASDSAGNQVTGAVDLLTFNLYVHATVSTLGYTSMGAIGTITLNTADLHFEFVGLTAGAGTGQLLAGGTITPLGAAGRFRMTGSIHCFAYCGAIGAPTTTKVPLNITTFTAPLPQLTGAIGQPHTLYGTASGVDFFVKPIPSNLGIRVSGTTFLVGREIARTPEPSTLPLLALGLGALGFASGAWRLWARG